MTDAVKMRADGQRNRAAILDAASSVFATLGVEAPLDLIAERAGVSRMTLYRNFKDRQDLAVAIYDAKVAELTDLGRQVADRDDGFFILLEFMAESTSQNRGLAGVIGNVPNLVPWRAEIRTRVIAVLFPLLGRAQRAGLVRSDLTQTDLDLLVELCASGSGDGPLPERRVRARRTLEILLRGLVSRQP